MPLSPSVVRQSAVIPVKGSELCVVTSRSGKRWVVPKGCLEPGMTAGETALQEAWEEAGLVGVLQAEPLGSYVYEKAGQTCHVTVFLMQVTDTAAAWPEQPLRERCWLTFNQALVRIEEPGLRDLIRGLMAIRAE